MDKEVQRRRGGKGGEGVGVASICRDEVRPGIPLRGTETGETNGAANRKMKIIVSTHKGLSTEFLPPVIDKGPSAWRGASSSAPKTFSFKINNFTVVPNNHLNLFVKIVHTLETLFPLSPFPNPSKLKVNFNSSHFRKID